MSGQLKAVSVMRACPMHVGHQAVIDLMIKEAGLENTMLLLGSITTSTPQFKYMFPYSDRYALVAKKYPTLTIAGLPDFPDDDEWIFNLKTTLALANVSIDAATFYGGSHEDVAWFKDRRYNVRIVNRYTGVESPPVSASQVRDTLLDGRSLSGMVDSELIDDVLALFDRCFSRPRTI